MFASVGNRLKAGIGAVTVWLIAALSGVLLAAQGDQRLIQAAADQDRDAVRALLARQIDVNAARADGATALLWAAHWNDLEMAGLLLGAGADVNAADDYGVTPLARASENASEPMVARLLGAGANPNAAQKSGLTPLMIASRTGNASIVKTLIGRGANVNAVTAQANASALMWALAAGHSEVITTLLEHGADVRLSTAKGFTPLMFAARNGNIDVGRTLIAKGAAVNEPASDGTHLLPFAILSGQDQFALFLLEQGADPNGRIDGVAALHLAAGNVATWLGDWSRRRGGSSLGGVVYSGRLDPPRRLALVKALLAQGADPNIRITNSAMFMNYVGYPKKGAFETYACGTGDLRGATPLWVAAYSANGGASAQNFGQPNRSETGVEVLQTLLAAGANLHFTTDDGTTPLMIAAGLGRATYTPREPRGIRSPGAEAAVKVLLEAGADINAVNEADFTALHGAAFRGLNEVVQYLVQHGANINARDFRGRTRTDWRRAPSSRFSFNRGRRPLRCSNSSAPTPAWVCQVPCRSAPAISLPRRSNSRCVASDAPFNLGSAAMFRLTARTVQTCACGAVAALALALAAFLAIPHTELQAQQGRGGVAIDADDIGGVVTGAKGPEAGVWVVAETTDTPTRFIRVVVTDDQGRYVVPDLPRAKYQVFVRGYGLVDSPKVGAEPGQQLNLRAVPAPDARAAAQIYPAAYWLSLMEIPKGAMPEREVLSAVKECMACHQLGNQATREIPKALGSFPNGLAAWDHRVTVGPMGLAMSGSYQRFGEQRRMFAEWTDRIAAGAVPKQVPPRPSGLERNLVVTLWDWAVPTGGRSDGAASDDRIGTNNANGPIWG